MVEEVVVVEVVVGLVVLEEVVVELEVVEVVVELEEEKGIVAGQRLCTSASGGGPSAGLKRETFAANNPFLLHVVVHVLEGVKAKVPSPQFIPNLG
ncbi:unnamed protein product [Boreogadus saida]